MGRKKLTYGYPPNLPILCSICGEKARGNNFDVFIMCVLQIIFSTTWIIRYCMLIVIYEKKKYEDKLNLCYRKNFSVDIKANVRLQKKQEVIVCHVD